MRERKLWYERPAGEWYEGLPIGTGQLAGMVLGTLKRDRLALNHEHLWTGRHRYRETRPCGAGLAKARDWLLAGKYEEGTIAVNDVLSPFGRDSMQNIRIDPYQPAGDLYLEFAHNSYAGYRRELDLESGVVTARHEALGYGVLTRTYAASLARNLLFLHVVSDGKPFDCTFWLDRMHDPDCALSWSASEQGACMNGMLPGHVRFQNAVALRAPDAQDICVLRQERIAVTGTRELLLAINIAVEADGRTPSATVNVSDFPNWEVLREEQAREYRRWYRRVRLHVPLDAPDDPTDQRIRNLKKGAPDPELTLLQHDYGRYLLIAASAHGEKPANLQGKWNEDLKPAWNSDYHHNINLQMNYWGAEPGGLAECTGSLFAHVEAMVEPGRKAAGDLFGCRGIWLAGSSDVWARSTLEGYGWSAWVGCAAWLSQHFWWRWEYGGDVEFLRDRAWPILKQTAEFFEDYLVEDAQGILQIVPSQSPENRFVGAGELPISLCVSSAMDIELVSELLMHAVSASEILNRDLQQRERWRRMLKQLPPLRIGKDGRLLEWNGEFEEVEPGHRHLSHLFGLYPGETITAEETPELFEAAGRSLDFRLANAGGYTGWSRAWTACCMARLGRGNDALTHLEALIREFSTPSMLDLHPPRIFQIDGNLGSLAAVMEMLLQSHGHLLRLLPALPDAWPRGEVTGLRARGGYVVDIAWDNGCLRQAKIRATRGGDCRIKDVSGQYRITCADKSVPRVRRNGIELGFAAKAGETYLVSGKRFYTI